MFILVFFFALILIFVVWAISIYNGLIGKRNQVEYAFSGIDVQLKKRRDLIPNLVASVKEYMQHERGLLEKITELRSKVMSDDLGDKERFETENQIGSLLGKVQIAIENYPDLKANQNVLQLQASLNEIEAQIAASRRAYNASVLDLNNKIEMFPSNIVANMMNMQRKESFEIPEEERENVDVGELFNK
jgi:LemA protein